MTLQQPDARRVFSWGSWLSLDLGTLAVAGFTGSPRGVLCVVNCVCTQDSWWQP